MSACAVCNETLDAPVLKKKRKRLYGTTCRDARQTLKKVLLESTGGEGVRFFGENALLYGRCDARLQRIQNLEDKLTKEKGEVISCLNARYHEQMTDGMCVQAVKTARVDCGSSLACSSPQTSQLSLQSVPLSL